MVTVAPFSAPFFDARCSDAALSVSLLQVLGRSAVAVCFTIASAPGRRQRRK